MAFEHLFTDTQAQPEDEEYTPLHQTDTLHLIPAYRRETLTPTDAGYDWAVGRQFVVVGPELTPHRGQRITVADVKTLIQCGIRYIDIQFNRRFGDSVLVELRQ